MPEIHERYKLLQQKVENRINQIIADVWGEEEELRNGKVDRGKISNLRFEIDTCPLQLITRS